MEVLLSLKDGNRVEVREAGIAMERHSFLKDQTCPFEADRECQTVRLSFHGQFNENYLLMFVPTKLLRLGEPLLVTLACNPHGISNDKRRIRFGQWESVTARMYGQGD